MARDIEYSFINGSYQKPSDNTTARKTRGLLAAITTNLQAKATATSAALSAATDTVTEASTPSRTPTRSSSPTWAPRRPCRWDGSTTSATRPRVRSRSPPPPVVRPSRSAPPPCSTGSPGRPRSRPRTSTTSSSRSGTAVETKDMAVATLIVNSVQKRAITAAYAGAYGKFNETSRTVGGVAVETIVTDFGIVNVMLNRFMPQDAICVASLEELAPVFLEVPGKGHFFAEPLAKTGASDDVQLYGEVGLAYGAESHHGRHRPRHLTVSTLASIEDYLAITGKDPAAVDFDRVLRLLEMASSSVLAGARSTDRLRAVQRHRPASGRRRPPPAAPRDRHLLGDRGWHRGHLPGWRWEPGGYRRPARLIRRVDGHDAPWTCAELVVTGTAGWDPIPGQLVAAVVAMAHGVAENNGSPALASEGAGPFNASVVPGHVQAPNMALTDSTRAIIDDLCGVARGASVAIIREWP